MPIRFYWKPDITWPDTGKLAGSSVIAISQVLEDCWVYPEAVPNCIGCLDSCTFTLGSFWVRYNPDSPESTMAEFLFLVRHACPWVCVLPLYLYGWGATWCNLFDVACVLGGRLQLCLVNNSEEVLFSLSLFFPKLRADPRRHNNLLRHPGCLMWELFF